MATKEEYEKALKEMNDAFYGITFLNSQTRRFDDNLNLLRELVNEHFEEKQETNYEYFKDEIIENSGYCFALVDGKPCQCSGVSCCDCGFSTEHGCSEKIKEWLNQPHEKPTYKLSQFEYDLLQSYSQGYSPKYKFKNINSLIEMRGKGYFKDIDLDLTIDDILGNCEVIKND